MRCIQPSTHAVHAVHPVRKLRDVPRVPALPKWSALPENVGYIDHEQTCIAVLQVKVNITNMTHQHLAQTKLVKQTTLNKQSDDKYKSLESLQSNVHPMDVHLWVRVTHVRKTTGGNMLNEMRDGTDGVQDTGGTDGVRAGGTSHADMAGTLSVGRQDG